MQIKWSAERVYNFCLIHFLSGRRYFVEYTYLEDEWLLSLKGVLYFHVLGDLADWRHRSHLREISSKHLELHVFLNGHLQFQLWQVLWGFVHKECSYQVSGIVRGIFLYGHANIDHWIFKDSNQLRLILGGLLRSYRLRKATEKVIKHVYWLLCVDLIHLLRLFLRVTAKNVQKII